MLIGFSALPAAAQPVEATGWWTVTNQGSPAPGTPALAVPVPADVPPGGLLVQGGPDAAAPAAFGALLFDLSDSVALTLTLTLAPSSASTPGAVPLLCSLTSSFEAVSGGPASQAPTYDCERSATGSASDDGTSYSFDIGALVAEDVLAVAVLPTASTDRLVFEAVSDDALPTTALTKVAPEEQQEPAPETMPDSGVGGLIDLPPALSGELLVGAPAFGEVDDVPGLVEVPLTAPEPGAPETTVAGPAFDQVVTASASRPEGGSSAGWIAGLLAVVGSALWVTAGRMAAPASAGAGASDAGSGASLETV